MPPPTHEPEPAAIPGDTAVPPSEGVVSASDDARLIARNAGSAYAVRILLGLSVLLLTPYLFRALGPAGFGTWSVMFTIASVFDLLEVGVSAGVTKLVAEHRARGEQEQLRATVGVTVAMMSALGLLAFAVSAGSGLLASGLAADAEREAFRTGMVILGVAMLLRFPCVGFAATLQGHQRYDLWNLSRATATVAFAAGTVIAIESGNGVLGVAVAYAVSLLVEGLLNAALLIRSAQGISMRPRLADRATRRRITGFSFWSLLADSMRFIGQRMDTVVIAGLRSAAAAGPFAAALKLQSGLQALTLPFVNLLIPMVSDLWARGERDEVVRRFALATRVALQLTLPVAMALALFAEDAVGVWLGSGAPEVTVQIVIVLMAVQAVTLTAFPAEQVLIGIGRVRLVGGLALVEGLSNLAVSIVLVSAYGAIGAALGTLLTSALIAPIRFPLAARAVGTSTGSFLARGISPALLGTLPGIAAMVAVHLSLPPGPGRLAAGMTAGLGISAAVGLLQLGPARVRSIIGRITGGGRREQVAGTG